MKFFGNDVLLSTSAARKLYRHVKRLPIIDYHCHLSQGAIAEDLPLTDVGEVWLSADHYKWRAMRLCGVDERYITGDAPYRQKFLKYAEILPKLVGNPLYDWTHLELKTVFGIRTPLCPQTAERVYAAANQALKGKTVRSLLRQFDVRYLATTDDPVDDLSQHGTYGNTVVAPTFRPDKALALDEGYLARLSASSGEQTDTLCGWKRAMQNRLDYFAKRGCKISDHGFYGFPSAIADEDTASALYENRSRLSTAQKDALTGHLLLWLSGQYAKRDMLMQLHFAVLRNCNPTAHQEIGVDAGFDLPADSPSVENAVRFFAAMPKGEQPRTVIYALNDANLDAFCALTGAFPFVKVGAAWWFNDTMQGNLRMIETVAQYSALGTSLGMLTDSRSFTSYVRFDYFRRLLCRYLGEKVKTGVYTLQQAKSLAADISYYNVKSALGL